MIFFYLMVGFGFIIKLIQFKYISKTFLIQIKYNFKMWTEEQLRMMIDERKNNNEYYHTLHEGRKMIWWGKVNFVKRQVNIITLFLLNIIQNLNIIFNF